MQKNNPSYEIIKELMHKYKGKVIVDNGCGNNEFKELYNKKIIGLEVSKESKADIHTDGKKLPFKDQSVDLFTSNFVLEHVDDEALYLKEMRRCLKKKGKIILSVPRPIWYLSFYISPFPYWYIMKNILQFLKAPNKFITHGHSHKHGIIYEIFEWRERNYEKIFNKARLKIIEKIHSSNIFSNDYHYAKLFGRLEVPDFLKTHTTWVLGK